MTEAEVAQQLIADIQANLGVIIGFGIGVLVIALVALWATLSNAARALREARESLGRMGNAVAPAPAMAFRAAPEVPAPARPLARQSLRPDVFSGPSRRLRQANGDSRPATHTPRPVRSGTRRTIV